MGLTSNLPASGGNNNQAIVVEGYVDPKPGNLNLATTSQLIGDYFLPRALLCCKDAPSQMRTLPIGNWW